MEIRTAYFKKETEKGLVKTMVTAKVGARLITEGWQQITSEDYVKLQAKSVWMGEKGLPL